MMEMTAADITSIFVQLNGRYFSFSDSVTLRHADCCTRVFHSPAYRTPKETAPTTAPEIAAPESSRA